MQAALYIKSSVLGQQSQTNAVVDALLSAWHAKYPEAAHTVRDLAQAPLPHLEGTDLAQPTAASVQALAELKAADVVVIAAPMYNFGVPSTLKAWLDHVVKAGETFRYTEAGPQGLLKGKRAVLVVSSGGVYSSGPYQAADFVVPYLKTVLGFIGITDVEVLRVEGVAQAGGGEASRQEVLARVQAL